MAKGGDSKKKKKGKDEKEKEKEKLKKGKSSDLSEEAIPESETTQSEGTLMCRVVSDVPDEAPSNLETVLEEPEHRDEPHEVPAVYYEEPILTKLIVESYVGETIRGLYEGVGIAHFQGGHVYNGMFSEGLMHGRGTYTWANGIKYEGDFSMNTSTGHGAYTWTDGSTYVGEVQNGIRHGQGIFTSADQSVSYSGQWHQAKRHGKGTIYYNQEGSSWYQGDWVNNVREGWGIRRYRTGNVYEGQWKNFARHGEGTMSWISTNEEYTGQWENGIQHGFGTHTWLLKRVPGSQYPLRNEYVGQFVMGARQGQGKFYYASGAVYDGEWVSNKKHGLGTFVFKNGRIFEGEFFEDRMAEFPDFSVDGMNTPDLSTIRTRSPFETGNVKASGSKGVIKSVLEHNVALNISSLLEKIPKEDRQNELLQLEYATLRYLTELKKMYSFYSCLGHQQSLDNTFLLSKLQFWRFLKDCKFHHHGLSLTNMDRLLHEKFTSVEVTHSPFDTLLLGKFLSYIIILGYHIYHKEHEGQGLILVGCFSKLMTNNLIPYACNVKGSLFQGRQSTTVILGYVNKCWEVYRVYCVQNRRPPNTHIMTMRHFIWMLKDLNLLSKNLTTTRLVEILSEDNPAVSDGTYCNMDIEMVFLEFLEALLACAAVYVTKKMIATSEASSVTMSAVNVIEQSSIVSLQQIQAPSEQNIVLESSPVDHYEHSTKSSTRKRGESSHKKSKAHPPSAEKPLKPSTHLDQSKSNAVFVKNTQKDEEQSQEIAQPLPAVEPTMEQSQPHLSETDEHNKAEGLPAEELPAEEPAAEEPPAGEPVGAELPAEGIPAAGITNKSESELEFWLSQICFFFMKRLFPAHDHAEVLKVEAKRDSVRQNELARLAEMKAAARARLKEEAIKCEQEETELSLIIHSPINQSDEEDKNLTPVQKDPSEMVSLPPTNKLSGSKKKKKSL
ncbi:radial spoke head 10 homolog B isoform X1 [Heptranchias perlo]|uniref:radial spoke head 10 homolog B isoform X1 n=1 Tax=Heptranchias perlo TaxID=212740 RepID=UPI00355A8C9F